MNDQSVSDETSLEQPPETKPQTVVVVDDSSTMRAIITKELEEAGYIVISFSNGLEALSSLHWMPMLPDLITLDVDMPKMDGFEVARLMRGSPHTRHTPIIFLSAIAHTEDSVLQGYAIGGGNGTGCGDCPDAGDADGAAWRAGSKM